MKGEHEIKFRKNHRKTIVPATTRKSVPVSKPAEKDGAPEEVAALARGLTVLRRVASADAPISNRELAELTGIPKPTVSRLTATLVKAGFLFQLPDSERFVLTASVLELSNGFLRNFDIRARARPFLVDLADRTALSVHLVTRDRLDMVVIEAVRPSSALLVSRLEIGSRMDLTRTAAGHAYLAALTAPQREALMTGVQAAAGDDWPHVHARVAHALTQTDKNGFAIETGAWSAGLNAIAAGFVGPSGERYAVNCGGAAHLCTREWLLEHAAPALVGCVAKIVREIGGAPRLRLSE
jgi:DNA-binding IclR family transcriptional regulator